MPVPVQSSVEPVLLDHVADRRIRLQILQHQERRGGPRHHLQQLLAGGYGVHVSVRFHLQAVQLILRAAPYNGQGDPVGVSGLALEGPGVLPGTVHILRHAGGGILPVVSGLRRIALAGILRLPARRRHAVDPHADIVPACRRVEASGAVLHRSGIVGHQVVEEHVCKAVQLLRIDHPHLPGRGCPRMIHQRTGKAHLYFHRIRFRHFQRRSRVTVQRAGSQYTSVRCQFLIFRCVDSVIHGGGYPLCVDHGHLIAPGCRDFHRRPFRCLLFLDQPQFCQLLILNVIDLNGLGQRRTGHCPAVPGGHGSLHKKLYIGRSLRNPDIAVRINRPQIPQHVLLRIQQDQRRGNPRSRFQIVEIINLSRVYGNGRGRLICSPRIQIGHLSVRDGWPAVLKVSGFVLAVLVHDVLLFPVAQVLQGVGQAVQPYPAADALPGRIPIGVKHLILIAVGRRASAPADVVGQHLQFVGPALPQSADVHVGDIAAFPAVVQRITQDLLIPGLLVLVDDRNGPAVDRAVIIMEFQPH